MLIARKGETLVEIINFKGETTVIRTITGHHKYGPQFSEEEEVNSNLLSNSCATDCLKTAKMYHRVGLN